MGAPGGLSARAAFIGRHWRQAASGTHARVVPKPSSGRHNTRPMSRTTRFLLLLVVLFLSPAALAQDLAPWTPERANQWYEKTGWLVGANYGPANAINQLEMWQAETFDLKQIDKELGWAESLGFNSIRVFLHDKLWEQDSKGFLERMDKFLE